MSVSDRYYDRGGWKKIVGSLEKVFRFLGSCPDSLLRLRSSYLLTYLLTYRTNLLFKGFIVGPTKKTAHKITQED